ncbi:MAG: RtcB family protein [Candidatus Aminicenantes bacterium]|nr:MAG: RtcB family protein [Candidatus Aminicenantes bacterium]
MMDLKRIDDFAWEIPKHGSMRVPTVIYTSSKLLESVKRDLTLKQAKNVACLRGIQRMAYVMPDAHQGYGFPIGGVAAFDLDEGIISPGGVGYDINCGVRLLKTEYTETDIRGRQRELLAEIFKKVPAGVGKGGTTRLSRRALEEVCIKGAEWAVENGYGTKEDLLRTEENGRMRGAVPGYLSQRAIERGIPQLGTLGSGNHFLEIQKVSEIYERQVAEVFGIHSVDQILIMIHCGSRGLGHQVASDYIRLMENKFGTKELPDRQLINAPIRSELGKQYYGSMSAAVNFAFANRQMIAHWVRNVFAKIIGSSEGIDQVYDVCHNVAKFEKHRIGNELKEVCIHRKGATRSFGPGREEIPAIYRSVGQPVLIPGSMGTASYILVGTSEAEKLSFSSTTHGAGRMMSRHEALRRFKGEKIKQELESKGIELISTSWKGVAEEASQAYKDIDEVVKVSHQVGIGRIVAKVVPMGVMKG